MNIKLNYALRTIVLNSIIFTLTSVTVLAQKAKNTAYLFTYFTGNKGLEESIRFAISNDGYTFRALNDNQPVLSSAKISSTGGVRDPHILRGADGKTFYMVVTDMVAAKGWDSNRAMVLLKSTDLIKWTSAVINIQQRFPNQEDLKRVWAPQTIYDQEAKKYLIYWSMKNGSNPDKIYWAYANKDFTDLETKPEQLFYSPTNGSCIDGDIILKDGKYHLFFKTEGEGAGIKVATSNQLKTGYVLDDRYVQQTKDPVEGAGVFKLNNGEGYILMYDLYTKGRYQFTKTADLKNFTLIDNEVSMDFHPRHGTVLPITTKEAKSLTAKWYSAKNVMNSSQSISIIKTKVLLDTVGSTLQLTVKSGTSLTSFDPEFLTFPGIAIFPAAPYDFTKGPLKITVVIGGKKQKYTVTAMVDKTKGWN